MSSRTCTRNASKSPIYNVDRSISVFINVPEGQRDSVAANDTDRSRVISFPLPRNFPNGQVIVPESYEKKNRNAVSNG